MLGVINCLGVVLLCSILVIFIIDLASKDFGEQAALHFYISCSLIHLAKVLKLLEFVLISFRHTSINITIQKTGINITYYEEIVIYHSLYGLIFYFSYYLNVKRI